ncbi:hypothetical protein [Beijerinckia indica]|uniref:hypothetical protein n=1 Tax=Beijerinckia indica TaxID=533 RepID=UPI0002E017DA|nr:hypothetical protein [Beijerinckia indica]
MKSTKTKATSKTARSCHEQKLVRQRLAILPRLGDLGPYGTGQPYAPQFVV